MPTEEVVEIRRGRKVTSERRFFPGYVLVKMDMTDAAYHLIKNTPKVTGFLGTENKPVPISEDEANRILHQVQEGVERPRPTISPLKLESRFVSPMGLSPRSTGLLRMSMKNGHGSKWPCRSLAGPPRSSWNTHRWRKRETTSPDVAGGRHVIPERQPGRFKSRTTTPET